MRWADLSPNLSSKIVYPCSRLSTYPPIDLMSIPLGAGAARFSLHGPTSTLRKGDVCCELHLVQYLVLMSVVPCSNPLYRPSSTFSDGLTALMVNPPRSDVAFRGTAWFESGLIRLLSSNALNCSTWPTTLYVNCCHASSSILL